MIYLYSGTPGSGKSLHLVMDVYNHMWFRKGLVISSERFVLSDKLKRGEFEHFDKHQLTPDYLIDMAKRWFKDGKVREGNILVVIDEAGDIFNSRTWNDRNRLLWLEFFRMHRHYGMDVILVAQEDKQLDKQIRGVIQCEWNHRKLSNFGMKGKILSLFMLGKWFCCKKIDYHTNTYLGSMWFKGKRKWYDMYNTFDGFL